MRFLIKKNWYSLYFKEFLNDNSRYQILYGGRGSGKTHHIILKLLAISFLKEYNHIVYVNKIFGHIKKNQFSDIQKVIKLLGLKKYFTINKTDYSFVNNITGTKFTALGMDDSENTKGISDPTIIWWDEMTRGDEEDFKILNALLRTPLNPKHQFIISFNPVSEKHWVRKYFFDETDPYKIHSRFTDYFLHHSTYLNNDFINKNDYYATLSENAHGNTNKMLVDIKGFWGVSITSNPFIYAYDPQKHDAKEPLQIIQGLPIYVSFDFNINPQTCIVAQIDGFKKKVRIIKEYRLADSNVTENCRRLKADFDTRFMFITGDASGWAREKGLTGSKSLYDIIQTELQLNWSQIKAPKSNISHQKSREVVNSVLHILSDFIIGDCPFLKEDLLSVQVNEDGGILKKTGMVGHLIDCFRYLIHTFVA